MLAAIISLLQDDQPKPKPVPRRLNFDMGGGGGANHPMYQLVDYTTALASFQEVHGEHPVARAARRQEHLERELPLRKIERENDVDRAAAQGFLMGATLQHAASTAEIREVMRQLEAGEGRIRKLESELALARVRASERGARSGDGLALFLLGAGAALTISTLVTMRKPQKSRRKR